MATMTETTVKPDVVMMSEGDTFPVVDFSKFESDPQGTAAEILEAASRWGFLVLKGHGIPKHDVDQMFATVSLSLDH